MLFGTVFTEHAEKNTRNGNDTDKRVCRKHTAQSTAALNITQADHPAGNAGTEDSPEDHINCLAYTHHTGVYETDRHNTGCGRRLDHCGNSRSQQHGTQGRSAQTEQDRLKLIPRHPFQAVPHQRHAEQEHCHAAEQRQHFQKTHTELLIFCCFTVLHYIKRPVNPQEQPHEIIINFR